jgi:hypothetical protein
LSDIREHIQRLAARAAEDEAMSDAEFDPRVEIA